MHRTVLGVLFGLVAVAVAACAEYGERAGQGTLPTVARRPIGALETGRGIADTGSEAW